MKETLAEIQALRTAGIIRDCAIGGAMGATFYLEPIATYDLDIFVVFEGAPLILTLSPIHDYLISLGHTPDGEAILVHGWPVQFLPAESPLLREAVERFETSQEAPKVLAEHRSYGRVLILAKEAGRWMTVGYDEKAKKPVFSCEFRVPETLTFGRVGGRA